MFGKHCKECDRPACNLDYCDKHFDKQKIIDIFKRSSEKHLKKFDKQKKQHQQCTNFPQKLLNGIVGFLRRFY